ncbi:DUF6308 family protein [Streptomyces sp. NPDC001177]
MTDLRHYFGIGLPPGAAFAGARFEQLDGGGDLPGAADAITAADLVAVQTLSVTVPARIALDILEGPFGAQLSEQLRAVPPDVEMVDAHAADLDRGFPPPEAWKLLCAQHGMSWVTAGKVMTRKRPRLLPVYDQVVRCAAGRPRRFWLALHTALRANNRAV